jgi:Ring finger domain
MACLVTLKCGHRCCGVKGEKNCLPCLHEDCAKNDKSLNGITGEEFCNICYVEGLINAPVIRSKCGHMFHYQCLKKKLEMKW